MKKFLLVPFFGLLALAGSTLAAQADMGTVIGIDLGTTYSWWVQVRLGKDSFRFSKDNYIQRIRLKITTCSL